MRSGGGVKIMLRWFAFAVALTISAHPWASAGASDNCWVSAGERYGVAPDLLYAIARVESGLNPYAREVRSGTESRGLMQVNSYWYPALRRIGISPDDLWNPCTNIHVGAWILAQEIARYGNTWTAIGAYNAGGAARNGMKNKMPLYIEYAAKVYKKLYRE